MQSLQPITKNIKEVPEKVKIASAKILAEHGYSLNQIMELTGIPSTSTYRIMLKKREDLQKVDPDTWKSVEAAINNVLKMKRDQLTAKILGKMEHEVDTKALPFGSLAFALKVLTDMYQPKNTNNLNLNANNLNVQVVRGDVTYSDKKEETEPK